MRYKTREILIMKANGFASKRISFDLGINRRTVEWHAKKACVELKAKNTAHAVAIAMRDGLILASDIVCIVLLCWSGLTGVTEMRRGPNPLTVRVARRETV